MEEVRLKGSRCRGHYKELSELLGAGGSDREDGQWSAGCFKMLRGRNNTRGLLGQNVLNCVESRKVLTHQNSYFERNAP